MKNSHPQKIPVTNSLPPMVPINLKSPIVRHERKNMRFFRLNRGASSEEDSSEEESSAVWLVSFENFNHRFLGEN